ncbi:MAG: DNA cytosine methyltransferase [Pseudomonadota bacterium]
MSAYYNEIDPYAAQWLRNLITAGHIAPGDVDERDIQDVRPDDLRSYTQCHFFAGIGVWSLALRRAGWADDRPVWTGSCPCQPFSAAGKGLAFDDERHLWPAWFHLIGERRPTVILGEQVASKDADAWLDLVQADLEGVDHAFGCEPFPSAGIGAPHIRDRNFWSAVRGGGRNQVSRRTLQRLANASGARLEKRLRHSGEQSRPQRGRDADARGGAVGRMEHAGHDHDASQDAAPRAGQSQANRSSDQFGGSGISFGGVADADHDRRSPGRLSVRPGRQESSAGIQSGYGEDVRPGPTNGFWRDADWLFCRDGKWRPVEPGTFPLAHGAPGRVGRLRAYGNAINAIQAQIWCEIVMEALSA